jgi:predicted dithiol-disulfide oxidoreductase (DUF899 family)
MFRRRPRPPSWSSRPGNPGLPRRGFLPEELAKGEVYYNYQMTGVIYKDEVDNISRTYSSYARCDEELLTTYIVDDLHRARSDPERPLRDWSARQSYRLGAAPRRIR